MSIIYQEENEIQDAKGCLDPRMPTAGLGSDSWGRSCVYRPPTRGSRSFVDLVEDSLFVGGKSIFALCASGGTPASSLDTEEEPLLDSLLISSIDFPPMIHSSWTLQHSPSGLLHDFERRRSSRHRSSRDLSSMPAPSITALHCTVPFLTSERSAAWC